MSDNETGRPGAPRWAPVPLDGANFTPETPTWAPVTGGTPRVAPQDPQVPQGAQQPPAAHHAQHGQNPQTSQWSPQAPQTPQTPTNPVRQTVRTTQVPEDFGSAQPTRPHRHSKKGRKGRKAGTNNPTGTNNQTAAKTATAHSRQRARTLISLLIVIIVVGVGGFFATQYAGEILADLRGGDTPTQVSDYPGPGEGSVEVTVNEGDSGDAIATALKDADVVATRSAFLDAWNADSRSTSVQPGTYAMRQQMSAREALAVLLDAANRVDFVVTIPEGQTAAQISTKLQSIMGLSADDVSAAMADTAGIGLPAEAGGIVEGWLMPGQYVFATDTTATEALASMVARRVTMFADLGVPEGSRQELLIESSIVSSEVASAEYYGKVARVIDNRMAVNMPLQFDSIVAYGAGKDALQLTTEDFQDSSNPYNSYVLTGLPPGPISNPGQEVVVATMNPEQGDWIYFITVNLVSGETRFTADYNEFLGWREEYLQWLEDNNVG